MTLLDWLVRTASARGLGWTLVHSMWEGAILALALVILLALTRSARVRYAAACLALLAMLAGFAITLYIVTPQAGTITSNPQIRRLALHAPNVAPAANPSASWDASAILPWLTPLWIVGVLAFQLRAMAGWFAAGRLRRTGVYAAPNAWIASLQSLKERLAVSSPVVLMESCLTEVPVVIGYLRPMILMPAGLLVGLPAQHVEAILLHELAHIRRRDYLVNLIQALTEGLLFYNPAAWWISSVIRAERENCCDDLAVAVIGGDARGYAQALATLEETRWSAQGTMALAATGGTLMKRIERLLSQPAEQRSLLAPILLACLLTISAAAVLAAQTRAATPPHSPYDLWLAEDVAYIINPEERAAFLKLSTDEERNHFIEQFWLRRDPTPGRAENEYREEHYRRIVYCNERFGVSGIAGWRSDRGRVYIHYGPPDEIESHPSGPPSPYERWVYRFIDGIGDNVIIEFIDAQATGDFRMTSDPRPHGSQVAAGIQDDSVFVSLPAEFAASLYSFYGVISGEDGRIIARFQSDVPVCVNGLTANCVGGSANFGFRPVPEIVRNLPDGGYSLKAIVKDAHGTQQRSYNLRFTLSPSGSSKGRSISVQ